MIRIGSGWKGGIGRTLAALALAAGVFGGAARQAEAHGRHYHHGSTIDYNNPRWMAALPDATPLAAMSIPATHDTMALYGGDLAQTQSLKLADQLNAGVRGLDIRLRHIGDAFAIHHGVVYQRANFNDVLNATTAFLRANPSETVLMRVKEEHTPEGNTRPFEATFAAYRNDPAYSAFFWAGNQPPTLGAARGKIVLLDNIPGDFGIPWSSLNIQDDYEVPTIFDIDDKWDKARRHFEATEAGPLDQLYVNFLSGSSVGAFPNAVAGGTMGLTGVNHFAYDYLAGPTVNRAGLVMMDFPGRDLIDIIIQRNAAPFTSDGVYLYEHNSYGGMVFRVGRCAPGVGAYSVHLPTDFNDKTSSLKILGSCAVTLFEHGCFQSGGSSRLVASAASLGGTGVGNDRATCVAVGAR